MPALSQNFTFTVNSTTSTSVTYPNTATTALTYFSDKLKGSGYYGNTDGFHTVQTHITNFIGKVEIQGSLSETPSNTDWFVISFGSNVLTMDTTGAIGQTNISQLEYLQSSTTVKSVNFVGNYTWLRVKISNWSQGTVNSISINF